jgi:hypothetical protein
MGHRVFLSTSLSRKYVAELAEGVIFGFVGSILSIIDAIVNENAARQRACGITSSWAATISGLTTAMRE